MKIASPTASRAKVGQTLSTVFLALLLSLLVLSVTANVQEADELSNSNLFAKNYPESFAEILAKNYPELVSNLELSMVADGDQQLSLLEDSAARMLETNKNPQAMTTGRNLQDQQDVNEIRNVLSGKALQLFDGFFDEYGDGIEDLFAALFFGDLSILNLLGFENSTTLKAECEANDLNCCVGEDACDFEGAVIIGIFDNTTDWNFCNGFRACQNASGIDFPGGFLFQNACIGDNSCRNSAAFFRLPYSCIGKNACLGVITFAIPPFTCIGRGSCRNLSAEGVFVFSCNGREACKDTDIGNIDSLSCNAKGACKGNTGDIAPFSCNALRACKGNMGTIGSSTCNAKETCLDNSLTIANDNDDCNVPFACQGP